MYSNSQLAFRIALIAGLVACCGHHAVAQLDGAISRVLVRPTTLKVDFNVQCGGTRYESLTENDVSVAHDGAARTFQEWRCPPEGLRPYSVVLLLDVSYETGSIATALMRAGSRAFIDSLDGSSDEASVMMYNQNSVVTQQMTTTKPMLYSALDQWMGVNKRYNYNALYHAVEEASTKGSHNTAAVIHFVTGYDEGSSVGFTKLRDLALSSGVRIYTISLNAMNVGELKALSEASGGTFAKSTDSAHIARLLSDIHQSLRAHAEDCSIVLPLPCTNGGAHDIALRVSGCDSTITMSTQYTAPSSGVRNEPLDFRLADCVVRGLDTVLVPLTLYTAPQYGVLYPIQIGVRFDPKKLAIIGAVAPAGTLFSGVDLKSTLENDVLTLALQDRLLITDGGVCAYLLVAVRGTLKPEQTLLYSSGTKMLNGCAVPTLRASRVNIFPTDTESLLDIVSGVNDSSGAIVRFVAMCDAKVVTAIDSALITFTIDGNRLPVRSLKKVSDAGVWEAAFDYACRDGLERLLHVSLDGVCVGTLADTFAIQFPFVKRAITVYGSEVLCAGDSVVLDAGEGFSAYRWSTGERSRSITVHKPDMYAVAVDPGPDNCQAQFTPVIITGPVRPRVHPPGVHEVCGGAGIELTLFLGYASYLWSNGSRSDRITASAPGEYFVTVVDDNGCTMQSDTVLLVSSESLHPVIGPRDSAAFCEGGGVMLDAGGPYARYQWSNGFDRQRLLATEPGMYSVTVWNTSGCTGTSAPVFVRKLESPKPVLNVEGQLAVCEGDTAYLAFQGSYGSLLWSTGETTREIFTTATGEYWLKVVYNNGCIAYSDTVRVVIRPRPIEPYITRSGNTLHTMPQSGYQWYRNGTAIPGADKYIHVAEETGRYQVEIFNQFGCSSISAVFEVKLLGIGAASAESFVCSVFPEPTTGVVNVSVVLPAAGMVVAVLTDLTGRVVQRFETQTLSYSHTFSLDIRGVPGGVYFLRVSNGYGVLFRMITKLS